MNTKIFALAAANVILTDGWCQNRLQKNGAVCASEAMNRVCYKQHPTLGPMVYGLIALRKAFRKKINDRHIVEWNDESGRTKEEVLAIFDEIANES